MIEWTNIEQNTDEWLDMRVGLITSSGVGKIMANMGKDFGDPAKRYAIQLARERITGTRSTSGRIYTSDMKRGDEMEPIARNKYEEYYLEHHGDFIEARPGGFFKLGILGDSPDSIIGNPPEDVEGVLEIKCPGDEEHYKAVTGKLKYGYPPQYRHQINHHLLCTGAKWCDFVSYNPDFGPELELYVYRVVPDERQMQDMKDRIAAFVRYVKDIEKELKKAMS